MATEEQIQAENTAFEPAPAAVDKPGSESDSEYAKPDPAKNPRNQALSEIASSVAKQHVVDAAERAATIDDSGNVIPAVAAEAPAPAQVAEPEQAAAETPVAPPAQDAPAPAAENPLERAIDPEGDYDVTVEGKPLKVKGKDLISAGVRTYQKEAAADYRLKMASELLKEAEAVRRAAPLPAQGEVQQPQPQAEPITAEQLAEAIQFGSREQAANAIKLLASRGAVNPEQIVRLAQQKAADEVAFQDALKFVQSEYGDILGRDHLKRFFFAEENRLRASGDRRTYRELYKQIGDDIRKEFGISAPSTTQQPAVQSAAPTATAAGRQELKARTPTPPRTAAARLAAVEETTKAKTPSEIIAQMQERRGQNRLTPATRK